MINLYINRVYSAKFTLYSFLLSACQKQKEPWINPKLTNYNMAEWVGFEPTHACASNDLANRPLQPLEYHSMYKVLWRRGWDSNPRYLAVSLVFKTSSLNHSDTSPY